VACSSVGIVICTQSRGLRFWEKPRLARLRLYLGTGAGKSERGYWAVCLNYLRSLCVCSYQHVVIIVLTTYHKSLIQIGRRCRVICRHRLLALCGVRFSFLFWSEFSKSLLRRISLVKASLTWYCIPSAPPVRVLYACVTSYLIWLLVFYKDYIRWGYIILGYARRIYGRLVFPCQFDTPVPRQYPYPQYSHCTYIPLSSFESLISSHSLYFNVADCQFRSILIYMLANLAAQRPVRKDE
jgi:hypothetical protein